MTPTPGAAKPLDLATRIEVELRARIEDAVDYACLDTMVQARRARGAPPPSAESPVDREEYLQHVQAFLEGLRVAIVCELTEAERQRLGPASETPAGREIAGILHVHVALARELPDYWQRFEAFRVRHADERAVPSGGERRGLLRRFLGRD